MSEKLVVKTEKLTKVFEVGLLRRHRVRALDKLDIEIHQGEVFGLLGPNGSGKSTTMKLLLGLLFPTSGKIEVLGAPPDDVSAKMQIGFLPEESYFYKFLNAEETLRFYGKLFEIPADTLEKRAGELIKMVGLHEARKRPLRGYSKGMSRRIGLAQALINDPKLIFLDEPTSGLDPIGNREMKDLVLRLKDEGKTVVLCSHLLADVQDVCDRIAILDRGVLQVVGPMKDLLTQQDTVQILARKLPEGSWGQVKEAIQQGDAEVVSMGHPTASLEDLFLKTVGRKEKDA
ncbi:MAG: ABC transporter ATP-binding protein [Planctomycetes bacterium]|nr:ABC transporter ATP-binding protein [Planctomycetota bacterium]